MAFGHAWINKTFSVSAADGVDMRFLFKCFCGRRLKNQNGDQDGWYCRRHGLQALFKEVQGSDE